MAGASGVTVTPDDLLASAGDRVPSGDLVVALSGGADSAVLAWLAVGAASGATVRAIHINHGSAAAADLEAAAREVASQLSLPLTVVAVDVPVGASFEDQARRVRLEALERAAAPSETILLGHHRDDVVETVIFNLARGAGARGLGGIARRRGRLVRPLLDIDGASLRAAADALELAYHDDPTNRDETHRRNAVRGRVVPVLDDVFGAGVGIRISRAAGHLAADDAALEAAAEQVPLRNGYAGAVLIPAAPLAVVGAPVAARAIQGAFRRLRPPYGGSADEVDAVLDVANSVAPRLGLSGGFLAEREGAMVAIYRRAAAETEVTSVFPLPERGSIVFGPVEIHVEAERQGPALGRAVVSLRGGEPWVVRSTTAGERVDIDGGSKLVRDAMSEAGIPVRLRAEWPTVARGDRIGWVAGARLAPWARAEPATAIPVTLRMERIAL